MNGKQALNVGVLISSLALAACGTTSGPYSSEPQSYPGYSGSPGYPGSPGYGYSSYSSYHGTVEQVETVRTGGRSTGIGAAIGGVAGGVLGSQVGDGRGQTAATIGGAVAGAVIGNEVERRRSIDETYRFTVRMDDGSIQTFTQDTPEIRVGSRVRNENGHLMLM